MRCDVMSVSSYLDDYGSANLLFRLHIRSVRLMDGNNRFVGQGMRLMTKLCREPPNVTRTDETLKLSTP